jgi:uncharacterized membrane protein YgcG
VPLWVLAVPLLFLLPASALVGGAGAVERSSPSPETTAIAPLAAVGDGGEINVSYLGLNSTLTDSISYGASNGTARSYDIQIQVSQALAGQWVTLLSCPLKQWGQPLQMPGGVDSLPPLSEWQWNVTMNGGVAPGDWSVDPLSGMLSATVPWENATYDVAGSTHPQVSIAVDPNASAGTHAPGLGFTLTGIGFGGPNRNNSDLLRLAQGLRPTTVRFGLLTVVSNITWNATEGAPQMVFTPFDRAVEFIEALPANVLLTLPAGTWGDGNSLPVGMPLNTTLTVPFEGSYGYFPEPAAYAAYLEVVIQHVEQSGVEIPYWSIGNEVPLVNITEVDEYIQLFNVASATIHAAFPGALVGSDVMTSRTYLANFAENATGVGFLSFHFYPANSLCVSQGQYCPPNGRGQALTDPQIWVNDTNLSRQHFTAPNSAQSTWANLTGEQLPELDTESDLNAVGGVYSASNGTDPRQQSTFAAAWIGGTLIDAAQVNLSEFTFFTFNGPATVPDTISGPFGGWGFGMVAHQANGSDTIYAPYWALNLWGQYVPAGAPGVATESSAASEVRSYAVAVGQNLSVILVNGVNTTVRAEITVEGGPYRETGGTLFDGSTYVEQYNPLTNNVSLLRSGVAPIPAANDSPGPVEVTFHGYGMCALTFAPAGQNSSGSHGSNGSGSLPPPGGNSSGNGGSHNGSGSVGSGNGTPPPNPTGNQSGGGSTPTNSTQNSSGSPYQNQTSSENRTSPGGSNVSGDPGATALSPSRVRAPWPVRLMLISVGIAWGVVLLVGTIAYQATRPRSPAVPPRRIPPSRPGRRAPTRPK